MLGGLIAAHWGWKAAFGGRHPRAAARALYLKVRDYETVAMSPALEAKRQSLGQTVRHVALMLARSRTMLWVCIGGAAQLIVVSALWSWLPSFLNRVHGIAPAQAGMKAALVVLAGAVGSVLWGALVDRVGARHPRRKLAALALLCLSSMAVIAYAFGTAHEPQAQFAWIVLGGFIATCSVGPVSAIVIDVIHPGAPPAPRCWRCSRTRSAWRPGPSSSACCPTAWACRVRPRCRWPAIAAGAFLPPRAATSDKARAADPIEIPPRATPAVA